ncbi:hypothetical protein HMPREF0185_00971 [Brevundimonas diminuta 470-4]|nr:hypothetical protein HMPREF0185_00971 [Brevundimonas diminuta 470-4]
MGEFLTVLSAQSQSDRPSAPEVPQLTRDGSDRVVLFVALTYAHDRINILQSFSALVTEAKNIQRCALIDCRTSLRRSSDRTAANGIRQRYTLLVQQLGAADDSTRRA